MPARWIRVTVAIAGAICSLAPAARAQETKLEPGVYVVPRSPGFVLRDGPKVLSPGSPLDIYRVERAEGDRLRLHTARGEVDARASEVVRLDQAEAYFTERIKAEPGAIYGYLMRCCVRAFQHDIAHARVDCEQAIRLEPKNPWGYLLRGEISGQQGDVKSALVDINKAIALDGERAVAYVGRAKCYMSARGYERALADLEQAILRDANCIPAYLLRAEIWEEQGDPSARSRR